MKNEVSILIDGETREILDKYRRRQKEIPTKKQALKELTLKGWKAYNTKKKEKS
ncbi:MAG: hypothetical protein U9N77_00475 [Thermodesulfobacteriota bacterium]|nr:hypothetical protein [Thermodesulfobacteriota bacterium]